MLSHRYSTTKGATPQAGAPRRRPGAAGAARPAGARVPGSHPLVRTEENTRLFDYERRVKSSFDAIVPALKQISSLQREHDFESRAQSVARDQLGFDLPGEILADAWVGQLDMRRLFSWCVFRTYRRFCDDFFASDPLGSQDDKDFQGFLQECGFHLLDVSPCADGRLAHVIRYVLRLPYRVVRRKSYAGGLFDVQDSLEKWTETELLRFREGRPNTADEPTRYLKTVVYHYSSGDPEHEGCAAHGSNAEVAARAGRDRLGSFQEAVQNAYCCGASIDLLLIGLDTDTDAVRIHAPGADGAIDLERYVDAVQIYEDTRTLTAQQGRQRIEARVQEAAPMAASGMRRMIERLIEHNLSQIDYVRRYQDGRYADIGHAERFIGAGKGFEEVQLRNLTYFAYLDTVEEAAPDLDVGVKIFSHLNVAHGLPIPVVVRFDYQGHVPGARERAVEQCRRVAAAMDVRYAELIGRGMLDTLLAVRDCAAGGRIEVLGGSVPGLVEGEGR
ncbi:MAG: carboxysome shell carbonic anhydrase [Chromatiales bacterium 21-64-14]|nr:MAG: carboxysome shell carbonic anhydrase [Chromatiales bacterium 21-64-14]HQU17007.1 carboxysome shell carbonic anhydrase [Gammaproteobacteria bacterium]